MCEQIGGPVRYLKRIATGRLVLGTLKKGDYRELTKDEVEYLKSL
jgi:23S rRNA pseudouridine2605 synthase